ncbi:tetratricopeptide repeat protein [Phenylobacterium montanum]|uniref:Tetratricopeptide repeat protein n=1 Tax=Phenylobacterium montanum TaxID=2823693 RepID=A0A975IUK8_9CAUL|nr:tetratricopeptide repeat protein [Caulobacter sp. S6]QUD87855.1 tetratricopeptide repeat protein [Caulobacter sp. S6]
MPDRPSVQPLAEIEARLARGEDGAELRYQKAGALAALGRREEAQAAYLSALALQPDHFGALNDLGTLLYQADFRSAARTCYAEAVRYHPDNPVGHINLGNVLAAEDQADTARASFEAALSLAPDHPDAHLGMANLLQDLGRAEAAETHRRKGLVGRGILAQPYRGEGDPCRVLLLVSASGGNVPTRFLLDDRTFAVFTLPVEAWTGAQALPDHDLVFNALGDADLGGEALDAAERVLGATSAPVINPPARIRPTGRAAIAERLAGIEGLVAPQVIRTPRETVRQAARRLGYPLLIRSPGFHTGRYFRKVEDPAGLAAALAELPGRDLLLIQYLDARDDRDRWRKFRVMMVGGRLYPLHLALSGDWKVHYFTADMAENAAHREAEAAFLADMPGVVGAKAMAALEAVAERLGLDYGGIDFGLGAEGQVLLFEANATMVVNPPDPDPRWDYRRAPVDRILTATRGLLLQRAARP